MPAPPQTIQQIVEAVRSAFERRRYDEFVSLFAEDATYELPFGSRTAPQRYVGVDQIRQRFDAIAHSPMTRLLEIVTLSTSVYGGDDPESAVVEFTATGTAHGAPFTVVSSLAVIRCRAGRIVQYRDYPNSIGIADAAGMLKEYAASLQPPSSTPR